MSRWRLDWPTASGERLGTAIMRSQPEDFQVEELMTEPFSGSGEHLCLYLEKRGDNTEYVARELATLAGIRAFDVSFCGLKDRHAVTRQWFSLYRPGKPDDAAFIAAVAKRWPVLDSARHQRKLRRGEHSGNRFRLRLRDVTASRPAIEARLAVLVEQGIPNYFGPQRFGRNGNNLAQAVAQGDKPRRGRSFKGGMAFSAARSWLFNEVLAERISQGSWRRMMDGEPLDAMITGPMWGDGGTVATGELGELERRIVAQTPDMEAVFASTRMKPERRPLALPVSELDWWWEDDQTLCLSFQLAPGGFATALIAELLDVVPPGEPPPTTGETVSNPAS